MMSIKIDPPFDFYHNKDGQPINNGYVYIGVKNLNPVVESNRITVYWDKDLLIPAAQPIRTINGYLSQSGTPGKIYTDISEYSIVVTDKNGALVYSALDAADSLVTTQWQSPLPATYLSSYSYRYENIDRTANLTKGQRVYLQGGSDRWGTIESFSFSTHTDVVLIDVKDNAGIDAILDMATASASLSIQSMVKDIAIVASYPIKTGETGVVDTTYEFGNPMRYGAKFDGVTNDTPAFELAETNLGAGEIMPLPRGTSMINWTANKRINIVGKGESATILKPYSVTSPVITLQDRDGSWRNTYISEIGFETDGTYQSDAFSIEQISHATNSELSGRIDFFGVRFEGQFDKHFAKYQGNIGSHFTACIFKGGNFHYWALGRTGPLMHAGNDIFDGKCHFDTAQKAVFYVDSNVPGTGMLTVENSVCEANPGFVFFIKGFQNAPSVVPLKINNVWFELNATAGSVTIDTIAYTPKDIRLSETDTAVCMNSNPEKIELSNNSLLIMRDVVSYNQADTTVDSTSQIFTDGIFADDHTTKNNFITGLISATRIAGGFASYFLTNPREIISSSIPDKAKVLLNYSFSNVNSLTFTGTTSKTATKEADGVIFDSCLEFTSPGAGTWGLNPTASTTINKFQVWSVDIRRVSGDTPTFQLFDTGSLHKAISITGTDWSSFIGITNTANLTAFSFRPVLVFTTVGTVRISALQVLEFNTFREALEFVQRKLFISPNPRVVFNNNTPPTTGTWTQGDICWNTLTAAGGIPGWVCTTGGTPGTWKAMATVVA